MNKNPQNYYKSVYLSLLSNVLTDVKLSKSLESFKKSAYNSNEFILIQFIMNFYHFDLMG